MLRNRKNKISLDTVRELDSFPKLPETYIETSRVGGTFSLLTYIVITWLVWSEINYYFDSRFVFKFTPDADYDARLKINIDITVAMPCHSVGADILDSTNQNVFMFGTLEEEDTWFELSQEEREYFDNMRYVNSYLREEFHAIQDLLWKSREARFYGCLLFPILEHVSGVNLMYTHQPRCLKMGVHQINTQNMFQNWKKFRTHLPSTPPDACRIHGTLVLNKVAGNFHVTAGKSLSLPRGHIHISAFMTDFDYNFTHRIHRFSFGDPSPGIVHPLEGDEKITTENMVLYQYFVEVVPTDVQTFLERTYTYQYSVKDNYRLIDHYKGSHGIPGIFFKYDTSALKVLVSEEREPLDQFLVRLCATVGGYFVTAGFLNSAVQWIMRKTTLLLLFNKVEKPTTVPKTISLTEPSELMLPDFIPTADTERKSSVS